MPASNAPWKTRYQPISPTSTSALGASSAASSTARSSSSAASSTPDYPLPNFSEGHKSLTEQIDTITSGGKLIFHIFGALAEFERDIIRERTQAGLAAARARGRQGGRPKLPSTARKVTLARKLYEERQAPVQDICRDINISRATLYRYLRRK